MFCPDAEVVVNSLYIYLKNKVIEVYVVLQGICSLISWCSCKLVWPQHFKVLNPAGSSDLSGFHKNVSAEGSLGFGM